MWYGQQSSFHQTVVAGASSRVKLLFSSPLQISLCTCVLICAEVFAEGRAILVVPNSIYPIQTTANPHLSFRTVLRVRPEQCQGNNVWSFYKSPFWQTVAGQCKTVPCSFSLDVWWNAARIVLVQSQMHRRGTELIWPFCVWGTNVLRISTSSLALLGEGLSLSYFHMQKLEGFESGGLD